MLSSGGATIDDPLGLLAQGQQQLRDDLAAHVDEEREPDELADKRFVALAATLSGAEHNLGLEIARLDIKVGKLAQHVARIDEHVVHLTGLVTRLDGRLGGVGGRLDRLEVRFDGLEGMVGVLLDHFGIRRPAPEGA